MDPHSRRLTTSRLFLTYDQSVGPLDSRSNRSITVSSSKKDLRSTAEISASVSAHRTTSKIVVNIDMYGLRK